MPKLQDNSFVEWVLLQIGYLICRIALTKSEPTMMQVRNSTVPNIYSTVGLRSVAVSSKTHGEKNRGV